MDIQFCWDDSETGCICGNECEPPKWIIEIWEAQERAQDIHWGLAHDE